MSKINLASQQWCDLVFEGRNKAYGAYRLRAGQGNRQLRSVILVLVGIAVVLIGLALKSTIANAFGGNDDGSQTETAFSQLQKDNKPKDEPKKPKEEPKPEEKIEQVKVKNSISFTVPKIVDDDKIDHTKELKTQETLTKSNFAVSSQDFSQGSSSGINIDDIKTNQTASNQNVPAAHQEEEVKDNAEVQQPASFPGGDAALQSYISKNLKYPDVALEQELQGVVKVRFKINKDGSVGEVQVIKSLSRECDAAAVAAVKKLPRFIPAKSQGHPIPVWFKWPIRFQLQ